MYVCTDVNKTTTTVRSLPTRAGSVTGRDQQSMIYDTHLTLFQSCIGHGQSSSGVESSASSGVAAAIGGSSGSDGSKRLATGGRSHAATSSTGKGGGDHGGCFGMLSFRLFGKKKRVYYVVEMIALEVLTQDGKRGERDRAVASHTKPSRKNT
jgi:uncharacterized membrane protein